MVSGITAKHIDALWERMARIYGRRWTDNFGEADDGTWLTGLRDLSSEAIAYGLERCRTRENAWPPTLPEFRSMCKAMPKPYRRAPTSTKPRNAELAERELGRMKQLLRKPHP